MTQEITPLIDDVGLKYTLCNVFSNLYNEVMFYGY